MQKNYKIIIVCGFFAVLLLYIFVLSAPFGFKEGTVVNIEKGSSVGGIALKLKEAGVIRSAFLFKAFVVLYGGEKHLIPANYLFKSNEPVYIVARRIAEGAHGFDVAKITIPEGFNNLEIAAEMVKELPYFNSKNFLLLAQAKEGYLFPDTYFFERSNTEEDVIKSMSSNFENKIKQVEKDILSSGKSKKDIIIMASLIEREAKGNDDRSFISGILWKRLSIGMPLQADAAPITYEKKGLPASPIGNPGLLAIKSAIYPQASSYLYYLHDKDGNIHYARSFAEHRANILKYLP